MKCIWCLKQTSVEPDEHIIPHSLGCPNDLIFRNGEVCQKCNSKNAVLDQAIVAEFDVARVMANVPNKKGNPPQVATRPNAEGGYKDGTPYINVNMERAITVPGTGRNLKPFANRPNDLAMRIEDSAEGKSTITVSQNGICNSKMCVRALHKIAFSVFAQKFGVERAWDPRFNAVRDYVRRGAGERLALLARAANRFEYRNYARTSGDSVFPTDVVMFQLVVMGFTIDLSSAQGSLEGLKEMHVKVFGTNWTYAPIAA
jgi:hypothetical protein